MTGLNIYGAGTVGGGPWSAGTMAKTFAGGKASGGRLSGLSSLPVVRRQNSGEIIDIDEQETIVADPDIQARLDAQRAAQNALVVDIPKTTDYVGSSTLGKALEENPQLDPEKVRAMREKSISEVQDIYSSSEGREKELLDAYLKRKKELLGDEGYPFANIQSAISAAMDEPTIAMGIIKGAEKAGQLTKADKKEVKLAELEMLGEEFGLEKEQLAKKERRALNIFERNSSLRKRLLSLPSELRDKVMKQINDLKGIQIKDATIAKLLADAEDALKGDTKGQTKGITTDRLSVILSQIFPPNSQTSFVPAGLKDLSPEGGVAIAEASKIIQEVADSLPPGTRGGTLMYKQDEELRSVRGRTRIANAVAAFKKSGGAGTGGAGGAGTGGAGGAGSGSNPASGTIIKQLQRNFNPRRPSSVPVSVS